MCQYIIRPCSDGNKISFGVCGRFTGAELLSFSLSVSIVCIWVLTGHWLLMDAMGMGLCVAFIAFVRLPSLKVSTLLLTGLLIYDVFWVFFSSYIFSTNVMVKVSFASLTKALFDKENILHSFQTNLWHYFFCCIFFKMMHCKINLNWIVQCIYIICLYRGYFIIQYHICNDNDMISYM